MGAIALDLLVDLAGGRLAAVALEELLGEEWLRLLTANWRRPGLPMGSAEMVLVTRHEECNN